MPFTPFHFGPSALVSLPLKKYIDVPIFILANVVIDLEPLTIMLFNIPGSLHPIFHTYLFGAFAGALWGYIAYYFSGLSKIVMRIFFLDYTPNLKASVISGILGFWLHVFIDSFMHRDMSPFYPLAFNPFVGIISNQLVYVLSAVSFIPVFIIYLVIVLKSKKKKV